MWDGPSGFLGSTPIVGGTVPLAVGAGLAAKLKGENAIGVSYFGDGACEEGVVQESLNLARMLDVPVLFVVENPFAHLERPAPENLGSDVMGNGVDGDGIPARETANRGVPGYIREPYHPAVPKTHRKDALLCVV